MEIKCKLSEVDDVIHDTLDQIKEPIRSYEVEPTEESLGWGRSSVCESDYTIHIPKLKIFYRYATEFDYDEEEKEEMPIEEILHFYHEGDKTPSGGDY